MSFKKSEIWTVPNVLTMIRLMLIPVFWVLMLVFDLKIWALITFCVATFTDVIDGRIARKYQLITEFGKLFDPLADKIMVLSVLITLWIRKIVPGVVVPLLAVKEIFQIYSSGVLYKKKIVVHSLFVGKFAQCALCLALFLCFFADSFAHLTVKPHLVVLWIGLVAAYIALFVYMRISIRQLKGVEKTYADRSE